MMSKRAIHMDYPCTFCEEYIPDNLGNCIGCIKLVQYYYITETSAKRILRPTKNKILKAKGRRLPDAESFN
jgi:hypothetical protein